MAFEFLQSLVIDEEEREDDDESDRDQDRSMSEDSDDDETVSDDIGDCGVRDAWVDILTNVTDQVKEFTEFSGPVHDLQPDDSQPIDYFELFLSEQMFDMMVEETNRYAEFQQDKKGVRDAYWKVVTRDDIYKYFYINIMFGLIQLPDINLYWPSESLWRVSAVADVMGWQRYQKIHQYFHITDSSKQPQRGAEDFDPLYKVRPLLDHVRHACSSVYKPERDISVDEAMIGFTGRLSFKQYIKNKPTPWGIKLWCCAEAHTGYVLNFSVYTGKGAIGPHGLGHQVVTSMVQPYLNKNHVVYFDNLFSSPALAQHLIDHDTYSCSTIRPNDKGWPQQKDSKQRKGDLRMKQKGMMLATQWMDKRQVNILSTNCDPTVVTVQRRTKAGPVEVHISVPVQAYNSEMFGVDLSDQHWSYYPVGCPGIKWWRYLVWYLVQLSIINGFQMMKPYFWLQLSCRDSPDVQNAACKGYSPEGLQPCYLN